MLNEFRSHLTFAKARGLHFHPAGLQSGAVRAAAACRYHRTAARCSVPDADINYISIQDRCQLYSRGHLSRLAAPPDVSRNVIKVVRFI